MFFKKAKKDASLSKPTSESKLKQHDNDIDPEQEEELANMAKDIKQIFEQEIPERPEFKQELSDKLGEKIETMSGKARIKKRSYRSGKFSSFFKDLFRFPWPRWAYTACGLFVVVAVGSWLGWKVWQQSGEQDLSGVVEHIAEQLGGEPVYADALIVLEKEGDTDRGVAQDGGFLLKSKEALDKKSVGKNISIQPAIEGDFEWSDDNTELKFIPRTSLAAGVTYKVVLAKGAKNAAGEEFERDMQWSFETVPEFVVTGVTPVDLSTNAPKDTTIEIEFNYRNLDAETFAQYFSLTPETAGTFETHDNKIVFLPDKPLKSQIPYEAKVTAGFPNGEGRTLAEDTVWEFQTRRNYYTDENYEPEPWFDFDIRTGGVYTWLESGDPEKQRILGNASNWGSQALHFSLYNIDLESMLVSQVWDEGKLPRAIEPSSDHMSLVKEWDQAVTSSALSTPYYSSRDKQILVDMPSLGSGYYFLKMTSDPLDSSRFVYIVINDTSIRYHEDSNKEALLWVVDQISGDPLANTGATFYALEGTASELGSVTTKEEGIARTSDYAEADAIVSDGAILFLTNRNTQYSDIRDYMYSPPSKDYIAVFALDRPLYMPGDEVFYKVVLRKDDDADYSVLPLGTNVVVRMMQWYGGGQAPIYEEEFEIDNDYSSIATSFRLPATMESGTHYLKVYVVEDGKEIYVSQQSLAVQFYRKPDYELSVSIDTEEVISTEPLTATASVNYFFGQPVSGQKVTYTVYRDDYTERKPGEWEAEDINSYMYYGDKVAEGEGTLDENGNFSFQINTDLGSEELSQLFGIEVTYIDDLQVTNYAYTNAIVHRGEYKIFPEVTTYSHRIGEEVKTDISFYDVFTDEPFTNSQDTRIYIERNWYEVKVTETQCYDPATKRQKICQDRDYIHHSEMTIDGESFSANGNATASYTFTPSEPGSYSIWVQGKDAKGNTIESRRTSAWVTDGKEIDWWQWGSSSQLSVQIDKEEYNLGDTAQFTIQSSGELNKALVIVHRGEYRDVRVLDISSGSASFELTIDDSYSPNFVVQAESPYLDYFVSDRISPTVSMKYQQLDVSVSFEDKTYLPGDEVTFDIQVNDSQGNGVESETVLYLVDKALLALKKDFTPDWFRTLYSPRGYYVTAKSSTEDVWGAMSGGAERGGGGDEIPRSIFKDSAAFEAHVLTDASGQAQVKVTLPHNLTTWVVNAKTITKDTKVGEDSQELLVSKKVIVRPTIPNFLIASDTLRFTSIVHNYTGAQNDFTVTLSGQGFDGQEDLTKQITLATNEQATVEFAIKTQDVSEVQFDIKAETLDSSYVDEVKQTTPVYQDTVEQHQVLSWELDSGGEATFDYNGARDARDYVQLSIEPTLANSLQYVYADIYGSTYHSTPELSEQLLSNIAIYANYDQLDMYQSKEAITEAMQDEITELQELYRADEGWGYFDYDAVDLYLGAYTFLAIGEARDLDADLAVSDALIDSYVAVLEGKLSDDTVSLDDKALIVYALASVDAGDLVATQALADKADEMLSGSVAHIALALKDLGDEERGRRLLEGLLARVQQEDTLAYLDDQAENYQRNQTKVYQTSIVLAAMSDFELEDEYVTQMARWLNQACRSFSWYQIYDNSQALRGLLVFAMAHDDFGASFEYKVSLNGEEIGRGKVDKGQVREGDSELRVSIDKLHDGENKLAIETTGNHKLYLSGYLSSWTQDIPESSKVTLTRVYRNIDRNESTTYALGDLVILEFTYDGSELEESEYSRVFYQLNGYLPAGFELVNTSLDNVSYTEEKQTWSINSDVPCEQRTWMWSDIRQDSVSLSYGHRIPNTYAADENHSCGSRYPKIYRVLVRAAFRGEFSSRPSVLMSENMPGAYAYSDKKTIVVQ